MNEAMDSIGLQQVGQHLLGVPPGLTVLPSNTGAALPDEGQDGGAKFKPIDLERLSPK